MSVVDDVKDRLDVVDVVSGYVSLKKAGRTFKAACPFHTEKTPSFVVDPQRQSWRCFGACATGGDAFSFVMRKEGIGFGDALRTLAERAGVEIRPKAEAERADVLLRVNNEAARFYQEALASPEGEHARRYLQERRVDGPTTAEFQIGLSPRGGTALKEHVSSLGLDLEHAVDAGLLRRYEDGGLRDFFRGRLMFPIHDRRGRVAGFGARTLDGSDPKYINTPTTRVFDKRGTLYGLHLAAEAIREGGQAVVVEGYMDAMAAHQHGYRGVVASMGTALTEQQVAGLRSMASKYVLALDPDAAGQEATLRSLESSWRVVDVQRARARGAADGTSYRRKALDLRIASLPPGRDPDALIREEPSAWERALDDAAPFMEFYIPAVVSKHDVTTSEGKQDAVTALSPAIAATSNAFEQDEYINLLADRLGVDRRLLEASISRTRREGRRAERGRRGGPEDTTTFLADRRDHLEDYTLALLLRYPDLRAGEGALDPDYFRRTENRELFTCMSSSTTMEDVRKRLDDTLHDHLDALIQLDLSPTESWPFEEAFGQAARRLEQRHFKELQVALLATENPTLPPDRDVEESIVNLNADLRSSFVRKGKRAI